MSTRIIGEAPPAPSPRLLAPRDRLLRLDAVEAATGCKKSTIYKLMKEGKFPKCIAITSRMSAWSESSIQTWISERINGVAV